MIAELTLASLENERYTFPPGVVNPEGGSSIRGADGIRWNSVIVEVARLAVSRNILAKERVVPLNGWDCTQDLDLR